MSVHRGNQNLPYGSFELEERHFLTRGRVWLDGIGALARLPLDQARLDRRLGLRTAGYVSGYRGSPLGGLDQRLAQLQSRLQEANVLFQPGVNEDLAATAVWGSQHVNLFDDATLDGVFGMWYGKAPGLDRSADAIRHANMAGVSPHGGTLAIVGDDPLCKSSTLPSDSAGMLRNLGIPVLAPATVAEIVPFGLYGWALSRFMGSWVGLLTDSTVTDASSSFDLDVEDFACHLPQRDIDPHIRLGDHGVMQLHRHQSKLQLAIAFQVANPMHQLIGCATSPQVSIVCGGTQYPQLRSALRQLGYFHDAQLEEQGIQILKLGVLWPLAESWLSAHLHESPTAWICEPPGAFLEEQIKSMLYGSSRTDIYSTQNLLSPFNLVHTQQSDGATLTLALGELLQRTNVLVPDKSVLKQTHSTLVAQSSSATTSEATRTPLFCSGCPHSQSTKVPEGSRALAGIGCHYMVQWMDRETYTPTHMGAEGVTWLGQAPFSRTKHIFANMGDGTYYHSGLLAVRAAVAAKVNITYKLLFNDVVAMTGGQSVDGSLTVADAVAQVRAEGVQRVVVVSNEPQKYTNPNFEVRDRSDLEKLQRDLVDEVGCSVLIYDQTCANELRRRRNRGLEAQSSSHVVINEDVCEGCGDCSDVSICSAIEPLETEFGTKRQINQTLCNQDMACLDGYCPAMVKVEGTKAKFKGGGGSFLPADDAVEVPSSGDIVIAGVGGTGVITISRILAVAAHLAGKLVTTFDQSGLAQKGGAVSAQVRIDDRDETNAPIPQSGASLILGSDPMTAIAPSSTYLCDSRSTVAVVNMHKQSSLKFVIKQEADTTASSHLANLRKEVKRAYDLDANQTSVYLSGTETSANMVMLGYAWQRGLIPLPKSAILRAISLNGALVETNQKAFEGGRAVAAGTLKAPIKFNPKETKDDSERDSNAKLLAARAKLLAKYQNASFAERYVIKCAEVIELDRNINRSSNALSRSFISSYFRLLYSKDEFEVARLLIHANFTRKLDSLFEPGYSSKYQFGSPWLTRFVGSEKVSVGTWFTPILKLLARFKWVRHSALNVFRRSSERRLDREILNEFIADLARIQAGLAEHNYAVATTIFEAYDSVKGYGRVREKYWRRVQQELVKQRLLFDQVLIVHTSQPATKSPSVAG